MSRWIAWFVAAPAIVLAAAAATAAEALEGGALYGEHCAQCHSADGSANTPVARAIKAPALNAKRWEAAAVTKSIREDPKHESVSSNLGDEELAAIVLHLNQLGD